MKVGRSPRVCNIETLDPIFPGVPNYSRYWRSKGIRGYREREGAALGLRPPQNFLTCLPLNIQLPSCWRATHILFKLQLMTCRYQTVDCFLDHAGKYERHQCTCHFWVASCAKLVVQLISKMFHIPRDVSGQPSTLTLKLNPSNFCGLSSVCSLVEPQILTDLMVELIFLWLSPITKTTCRDTIFWKDLFFGTWSCQSWMSWHYLLLDLIVQSESCRTVWNVFNHAAEWPCRRCS